MKRKVCFESLRDNSDSARVFMLTVVYLGEDANRVASEDLGDVFFDIPAGQQLCSQVRHLRQIQ